MSSKLLFVTTAVLFYAGLGAAAQVINADKGVMFSRPAEEDIRLDGLWKFSLLKDTAILDEFYKEGYQDGAWDEIPVPGCWDALGYVEPRYVNPVDAEGLYRVHFDVPRKMISRGRHLFLRFDGVLRGYEIWVNGEYAGKWESAYNSCHFDITPFVKKGDNILAVRNYTRFKGSDFDGNDDWGQVGINRSVSLSAVEDAHISDIAVETSGVSPEGAKLKYSIKLDSFCETASGKTLVIKLKSPEGKKIVSRKVRVNSFPCVVTDSVLLRQPELWSAETPGLYTMDCRLGRNGRQLLNVGIREVSIDGKVLKVNGVPVKLRGVCYHDTDPFDGKVISRERLIQDLTMMKQANVNFIRCSHYPKAPAFYDLCDSLGFYVMDEVPYGFGDRDLYDESFQDILLTRADATVRRDRNHPSVIVWSVGNENPLTKISEVTGKYVKSLDPSRPICYPMMHDYFKSLDFNIPDFVDIFAPHYPLVETLRYFSDNSDRPLIFTEYCHSLGQSLEQHDELWEMMQGRENVAGGAVWEWVDQGMVDRNGTYPGRFARTYNLWLTDTTCIDMHGNEGTDGILYADRTPLSNYYEVRQNYSCARILTDTLICSKGVNSVELEIDNRFDFVNLSGNVGFDWSLKNGRLEIGSGCFSVECGPGESASHNLEITLPDNPEDCFYSLEIAPRSERWGELGLYSIPIISKDLEAGGALYGYEPEDSEMKMPEIFLRVGRKKGLAEELRSKSAPAHYLIEVDREICVGENKVHFSNEEFSARGEICVSATDGRLTVDAEIVPDVDNVLLLEAGLAFKFDKEIQFVQWVGNGPYATYPGKCNSGYYGIHSLKVGDLYFEGNRMGVDAVAVTDTGGKGYLIISKGSKMNFENTDEGLFITVNDKVSGICCKLRPTAFPVYSSKDDPIRVSLSIAPFDLNECPDRLKEIFVSPSEINPFNPFIARYDDFELPLKEIL